VTPGELIGMSQEIRCALRERRARSYVCFFICRFQNSHGWKVNFVRRNASAICGPIRQPGAPETAVPKRLTLPTYPGLNVFNSFFPRAHDTSLSIP